MSPYVAELIGTFILILVGGGVNANMVLADTKGHGDGWMLITTGWAMAVYVAVVVSAPYSGAHINPAVSLGVALDGGLPWYEVPMYVIMQMVGAFLGAATVWLVYKDHFARTKDEQMKLAVFSTIPAIRNKWTNVFGEIAGTFVLMFVIYYLADGSLETPQGNQKMGLGSVGAIPVALLVWAIGMGLGGTTGYAINPARDLGPRLFHALINMGRKNSTSDWSYAWVPVLGPLIGALMAYVIYKAVGV